MLFWRFASIVRRRPRVVLDTNVLISASIAAQGFSAAILLAARRQRIRLIVSPYIIEEYSTVIRRPHIARKYSGIEERVDTLIRFLNTRAIAIEPQTIAHVVPDDPKDDAILACAVEGMAQYIVTADEHLLRLGRCGGIAILTPRDFAVKVLHLP